MKARKLIISLEVESDLHMKEFRDKEQWHTVVANYIAGIGVVGEHTKVHQVQVNAVKDIPKKKGKQR